MEHLREQVMINQFVQVTGSEREQAAEILSTAQWQLQAALSRYFDETVTPYRSGGGGGIPWGTPSNTPATPPNFGEALAAFSALSTAQGCKLATSPLAQAPRQYLPMSPPNQPFSPPSKNLPLPQRQSEMARVRHDSEVQGGGKVAVRGEEVKPTTTAGNMREGERDLPMPDQEFEMELEN